jgi:hypothetical protein
MALEVRPDEWADRHEPETAGPDVVERAAHERRAQPMALELRIDLGVDEHDRARFIAVVDVTSERGAPPQLVAVLRLVVHDAVVAGAHAYIVPRRPAGYAGAVPDDGAEVVAFEDAAEWEAWLEEHHADRRAVWIRIAKKASGIPSVTADEGTEVALCFGWIDSHRKAGDTSTFLQKYTPRQRRSPWSAINRERAERLIAAHRMRPAGFAEIERAKASGRWRARRRS